MSKSINNQLGFYSGLSGLILPIPKYLFPPAFQNSSRLTYYASHFNSIEFNSTFYNIPQATTVAKWAASAPENFKFTFKLWKGITHVKGFDFKEGDIAKFFSVINKVSLKKGCILVQFPPRIGKEYMVAMDSFLRCIQAYNTSEWHIAVEFRNTSWYDQSVYDFIHIHNASIVIHDKPKSATPMISHESTFVYIRFHGPSGNYKESYSEEFLTEYASYINEWLEEGKTVYTYFNNTAGDAYENLKFLNKVQQDGEHS